MLVRQPGLQSRQGGVRMGLDMGRQSSLLTRRQLARPVTAPRAGAHLAGALPPDQRLVDVGHADPEHARRRPCRHAAVHRRQNPSSQILRIALPLPPSHRHPQHLAVGAANHTSPGLGIAFSDSSQCGYALPGFLKRGQLWFGERSAKDQFLELGVGCTSVIDGVNFGSRDPSPKVVALPQCESDGTCVSVRGNGDRRCSARRCVQAELKARRR